jgi:hypothetical protein
MTEPATSSTHTTAAMRDAAATMAELTSQLPDAVAQFLRLSVMLTGYEAYPLLGTGMLEPYYNELARIIGERELGALLGAGDVPDGNQRAFRSRILDDVRFGPVARNVTKMWYLGTWTQLPRAWRNMFGATSYDTDHVVSAAAYRAGLVWPTAGAHPMGAKQQGYASWSEPPLGFTGVQS